MLQLSIRRKWTGVAGTTAAAAKFPAEMLKMGFDEALSLYLATQDAEAQQDSQEPLQDQQVPITDRKHT